jgi:hypothetical protein
MRHLSTLIVPCFVSFVGLAIAACGGPKPAQPPEGGEPTAAAATAEPAPLPSTEPTAAASASADASAAAPVRKPSGRTATIFESSTGHESKTCGSTPPTILKLTLKSSQEPAVLSLPEFALPGGYNVTWKEAPKGQAKKPIFGPVFQLAIQEAGQPDMIRVDTVGVPFEVRMPLWGKDTVNLAYGDIKVDEKGKEQVTWTVLAPKNVDKGLGNATFELPYLSLAYVHATGAEATAAKAP